MVRLLGTGCLTALCIGVAVFPAQAQESAGQRSAVHFDVPAGPLGAALERFTSQSGYQLLYASALVSGKSSPGVTGDYSVEAGLAHVLADSGLTFRLTGDRTIQIIPNGPAAADGERVLGAVRVEGEQQSPHFGGAGQLAGVNGVNGSRDITATEGTKSFTSGALTIGSKAPQAMKDVPQSVSILTSELMQQQNVTDFTSAMQTLPGITLVQGTTSLQNTFYSRGFAVTSIQIDGGAPLTTLFGFQPQIDMSIYDHVELVRGANGLFDGNGDPSGTVNLVRKKPLDHSQLLVEGQAGSWENYRLMIDAAAPLALDGRLRGRLVTTWQDNHHFYEIAKDNKQLLYGILEFDATPTTLLTAGMNYTRQDSVPWYGGLPRFANGQDLRLPRSTALIFPWNRWNFNTTEFFGGLEQKIADDWKLKVNLTYDRQRSTQKVGVSSGAVNPVNDAGPRLLGNYNDYASRQFSAEAVLTGAFTIFGQRQEVTIGVNRVSSDGGGQRGYATLIFSSPSSPYQPYPGGPIYCYTASRVLSCPAGTIPPGTPPIDVFNFNPYDRIYSEPPNPLPALYYSVDGTIQTGAYVNLRLTAFDRLHLITGVRWSHYENRLDAQDLCTSIPTFGTPGDGSCFGLNIGDPYFLEADKYRESNLSWPPAINLSYDVTKALSAYVGYTDIFTSQANDLTSDHKPLPPVRGSNFEAGFKWAARGGKLNASISAYRIIQKGFATPDPNDPNFEDLGAGITCCYVADPNQTLKSEGIDLDVTGEIRRGWQIAGSYNFNNNKQTGSSFGTSEGLPFTSIQPRNLYKLWTSYDFTVGGHGGFLSGLMLSGGVQGQSSAYYAGFVCVNPGAQRPDGAVTCLSGSPPDTIPYSFTVPGHVVASLRIDYKLTSNWSLALNVENIFDKTYYQTVGSNPKSGNWYGAPRNFTATLRAKW